MRSPYDDGWMLDAEPVESPDAARYFAIHENPTRKCPTPDCRGTLEYITSEVREGEHCQVCTHWTFGRKVDR